MLALALTLTVLAAPPRGLPAAHTMELVTQVEQRLPGWLLGGGDRKALLATPKELEAFFVSGAMKPTDLKRVVERAVNEQAEKAELAQFTATRVLLAYTDRTATLHFFDAGGHRCEVPMFQVGTQAAPRYVLLSGPLTDTRTLESVVESGKAAKSMLVFAEKQDGGWTTGSLPTPPPPDCMTVMKQALKTIFTAEKSYFAEFDAYSNSLSKVGVDVKTLGITSAKVSVAGAAPTQTFVIQVGLRGGVLRMDDKGALTVVGDCTP